MKAEVHIALEVHDGQYVLTRRCVVDGREQSCVSNYTAIAACKDDVFVGCPKLHVNPAGDDDYPGPTNPLAQLEERVEDLEDRSDRAMQEMQELEGWLRSLENRTVGIAKF